MNMIRPIPPETIAAKLAAVHEIKSPELTEQFQKNPRYAELILFIGSKFRGPGGAPVFIQELISQNPGAIGTETMRVLAGKKTPWTLEERRAVCEEMPRATYNTLTATEQTEKRRQVLLELGFESAKHIDARQGFDDVKQRLEALAGKVHNERPDAGQRRRIMARIGEAMADLEQAGYPAPAIGKILRIRFKVLPGIRTLSDLETEDLLNLSKTLSARLVSWTQWQELATALRSILMQLAMCKRWPAASHRAATNSAASTPPEMAVQTLCRTHADELPANSPPLFLLDA